MFPTNTYRIWLAEADDAEALSRLEEQSLQEPLVGRVLIAEINGSPAAALALHDGRAVTDPCQSTDWLVATLRMRADAIRTHEARLPVSELLRAELPVYRGETVVMPALAWSDGYDDRERLAA